jgi:hypothetical protein
MPILLYVYIVKSFNLIYNKFVKRFNELEGNRKSQENKRGIEKGWSYDDVIQGQHTASGGSRRGFALTHDVGGEGGAIVWRLADVRGDGGNQ